MDEDDDDLYDPADSLPNNSNQPANGRPSVTELDDVFDDEEEEEDDDVGWLKMKTLCFANGVFRTTSTLSLKLLKKRFLKRE
jgi:hypothetical protein